MIGTLDSSTNYFLRIGALRNWRYDRGDSSESDYP